MTAAHGSVAPIAAVHCGWGQGVSSADTVEKVGFEVVGAVRVGGHNSPRDRRDASGSRDRRRHRDQHGEFAEVLGGGGEVELVVGAVRPS